MPRAWSHARELLAPLAQRAQRGREPDGDELLDATLRAYRLRHPDIEALLQWTSP